MGTSTQDMINQLQAQLAVGQQPTFGGIQGQADPNALQGLLAKLKGQQYVQQAGGDNGDPYGFLTAPSRRSAAALGQQMGSMLNGPAIGAPPPAAPQAPFSMPPPADQGAAPAAGGDSPAVPVPTPAPGATKQETENNELRAAQAYNRALIKSGMPADQAKVETLTKLVGWGHPQAADALDTAQKDLLKNQQTQAQANHENSQAKADLDNISHRALDDKSKIFTDAPELSNPGYFAQRDANGKVEFHQRMSAGQAAANGVTDKAMQGMLDFYHTNGTLPPGIARGGPQMQSRFWDAEGQYQQSTGNTAASATANRMANSADQQSVNQTSKQLAATTSYFSTMDKNIDAARTLANQVNFGDVKALNAAEAAYQVNTSNPTYAKYNVFFDSIANEYAKIKSGSLGNTTVTDAARKEAMKVLAPTMGNGGAQAAFDAIKQEGNNRVQSLTEQRDQILQRVKDRGSAPVATPAATSPPAAGGWQIVNGVKVRLKAGQ